MNGSRDKEGGGHSTSDANLLLTPDTAPPWRQDAEWCEAHQTLAHLVQRHDRALHHVSSLARSIQHKLQMVFPYLSSLCAATCPWCPAPCCMTATVWFDFKDLVFLHVSGRELPPVQVGRDSAGHCCYLGSKGCRLNRFTRPWICTWYVCETQKKILNERENLQKHLIDDAFGEIKRLRRDLEDAFIDMVTECPST